MLIQNIQILFLSQEMKRQTKKACPKARSLKWCQDDRPTDILKVALIIIFHLGCLPLILFLPLLSLLFVFHTCIM